jgi:dCMP deaminase
MHAFNLVKIKMKEKFVLKYMRMAKFVAEDQNPCYSRHVGAVIVSPILNKVVGTGYNGPPKGVPHCDTPAHLEKVVWPQINNDEKCFLEIKDINCNSFVEKYKNCGNCPRRLVGAKSGERLELCSCVHAETNAIVNAAQDVSGFYIFCWCPLPCVECSKLIINAGIKKVYCYKEEQDYSVGSRFILEKSGIEIIELDKNLFS